MGESERLARAGNYVLGLMNAADRERAERDLEIDPAFRDAVLSVAERMRVLDFVPQKDAIPEDWWKLIAARIGEMPQMRGLSETSAISTGVAANWPKRKVETVGRGLHAIPSRQAMIYAISLIAAFAAGYLAAVWRM